MQNTLCEVESSLIASIKENPMDETNMLVYADWLEENGRIEKSKAMRTLSNPRWHDYIVSAHFTYPPLNNTSKNINMGLTLQRTSIRKIFALSEFGGTTKRHSGGILAGITDDNVHFTLRRLNYDVWCHFEVDEDAIKERIAIMLPELELWAL